MHVAIIGGGVGGLCLAQGLQRSGVSCTVYERDESPEARLQGYRLNIEPIGAQALHDCLPPDLWAMLVATAGDVGEGMGVFDEQLHQLMQEPTPPPTTAPEQQTHAVSRVTLRRILLLGLDRCVVFGKTFARYELREDGKVVAVFADGTTADADVLVGADGFGSRVRQQLLPRAREIEAPGIGIGGKLYLNEGTEAWLPRPLLRGKSLILPKRDFLFTAIFRRRSQAPVSDRDYLMWAFVAHRQALPADILVRHGAALREIVTRHAAQWSPVLRRIFEESDDETIERFQFRAAAPVKPWPSDRVTLLGDAIHFMPPVGGLGGNMALADAARLRLALVQVRDGVRSSPDALAAYQAEMLKRGFGAVREATGYLKLAISGSSLMRLAARAFFRTCGAVPFLRDAIFG